MFRFQNNSLLKIFRRENDIHHFYRGRVRVRAERVLQAAVARPGAAAGRGTLARDSEGRYLRLRDHSL